MQPPSTNGSVIAQPINTIGMPLDFIISVAQVADEFLPWGVSGRDKQLRQFWPTEQNFAGALFSTIAKYDAFGWELQGPESTVTRVYETLHRANFSKGWDNFLIKFLTDLFTQDNGAFIEFQRYEDDPRSPIYSINHLDSARCFRTGALSAPVKYLDVKGNLHELKWYQVASVEEFPSPIEEKRGMQYCALTRLLKAAQIMRDISTYEWEKISGRFVRALYAVGGIQTKTIDDALRMHNASADAAVLTKYIQPAIVGALDPTARVSVDKIELASMPDHFDKEQWMRWYINNFALAFGGDYQDYAPLPGGNLGTASQSTVLHAKGRGKGPALFMSLMESLFNYHGLVPRNVKMKFVRQDVEQETAEANLRLIRAQTRAARIASLEITPEVARQEALDDGDLRIEYLEMLGEKNETGDIRQEN